MKIKTKLQLQQSNANEVIDLRKYFHAHKGLLEFDVNQIYNEMNGISTSGYDDYYDDKRRNKKRGDGRNKKYAQKSNVNEPLHFEDCNMASYLNIDMYIHFNSKLKSLILLNYYFRDSKTLYDKFRELISEKEYHTIRGAIEDYFKGRVDHKFLFSKFLEIFGDRAVIKIDESVVALTNVTFRHSRYSHSFWPPSRKKRLQNTSIPFSTQRCRNSQSGLLL